MKKSNYTKVLSTTAIAAMLASVVSIPAAAANRDFHDTVTGKTYAATDWRSSADSYNTLLNAMNTNPGNLTYEFGGKQYDFVKLSNVLSSATDVNQAFLNALNDSSLIVTPVNTKLAVSAVSIVDAQHITVAFNAPVLAGSGANGAEYAANYAVSGVSVTGAALSADGKTVTLTIGGAGLSNDTAYTVTVNANIQDANGVALDPSVNYKTGVFFSDHIAPTITNIAGQPNGDVKITFSERVAASSANVVINGQTVVPSAVVDNTVTIPKANLTAANLVSGTAYPVVVSGYNDLATNPLSLYNSTFTYTVVADTTAPTVTSLVVKDEKTLTLTFSEAINGVTANGTTDNATALGLAITKGVAATPITGATATTTDGTVFTITLPTTPNAVYDGTATPAETSAALAVTVNGYKDTSLNVGQKYTQNVTMTKDTTAPTLVKGAYDATANNFVFTFSEGLAADGSRTTLAGGITIIDSNGVAITSLTAGMITSIAAGDKTVTISNGSSGLNLPAGTYTFTFGKNTVKDNSLNSGNGLAQPASVTVTSTTAGAPDTIAPTITGVTTGAKDRIVVAYSEAVKGGAVAGSATDVANYKLNGAALPAGTLITLNTGKTTATISMPTGSVSKSQTYVLTTANVQDLAGNVLTTVDKTVGMLDSVAPVLQSASYDAASQSIVLTFSEDVNGKGDESGVGAATKPVAADFVVKVNGVADGVSHLTIVNGSAENQIKVTSNDMSFATGTITISTVSTGITGADGAANTLTPDTTVTLTR